MMLSLDTAYRSFGGEVEASNTPTICRLPDSRRHQLSAIAPLNKHPFLATQTVRIELRSLLGLAEQFVAPHVARSHQGGKTMVTEARETGSLIGSDKVEGTAVYGANDTKIGSIERVMIDKLSGKVSYAVLSFGGFLGIGDDHYPLPWQSLKYDTNFVCYVTGITETQLKGAPKYSTDST